jgi:hypothetical protein
MGTPLQGGKKDVTPPRLESSKPAMKETNWNGKRIILSFNEFIQLKDIRKNLIVSPPLKKFPEVNLRNYRDIIISFEDTLKPNTTYTFYFGSSIVDNNEGNPLPNFNFVFSTGSYIDSMMLIGRVLNSFDHQPIKEGMFVMLYPVWGDTIPTKTLPAYVTKTNNKGWFTFNYVKPDTFMIFALKDGNANYLYDMPDEEIAFSDTLLNIDTSFYQPFDSSIYKIQATDSVPIDSIDIYAGKKPQIELFSFTELNQKQALLKYDRPQPSKFSFIFEMPPADTFSFALLKPVITNNWFMMDKNVMNDTLEYWITDTSLLKQDTLQIKVTYTAPDSAYNTILKNDTVRVIFKKPLTKARKETPKSVIPQLVLSMPQTSKQAIELNEMLFMETSVPFDNILTEKIKLYRLEDTLLIPVKYTTTIDSIVPRKIHLNFTYEPGSKYKLIADTMAFHSIYGQFNDSTGFNFETRRDDYYSIIKLNLKNVNNPLIVQLLDEKGNVLKEQYPDKDELITFDFLAPTKYGLKVIHDFNRNKKWDTGYWLGRLQPEPVEFFDDEISLRSNWDKEITWEVSSLKNSPSKSTE